MECSLVEVCVFHGATDADLACFHYFAANDHLIEDLVDFVEIEDEIELANATEILVQHLHKQVDELEHGQLVVFSIDTEREEEPCVPPIHDLVISILRSSPHANTSKEGPSESNSEKPKRRSE